MEIVNNYSPEIVRRLSFDEDDEIECAGENDLLSRTIRLWRSFVAYEKRLAYGRR